MQQNGFSSPDFAALGLESDVWVVAFRNPPLQSPPRRSRVVPSSYADPKIENAVQLARRHGKEVLFFEHPYKSEEIENLAVAGKRVVVLTDCRDLIETANGRGWRSVQVVPKKQPIERGNQVRFLDWLFVFMTQSMDRQEKLEKKKRADSDDSKSSVKLPAVEKRAVGAFTRAASELILTLTGFFKSGAARSSKAANSAAPPEKNALKPA